MELNTLKVKDKKLFDRYLRIDRRDLSVYAFTNIYIWRALFDIRWALLGDNLCLFFKDKVGCFMYLSPLGGHKKRQAAEEAFRIMDRFNKNKAISRIENVEEKDLPFFKSIGYDCRIKSHDYVCLRSDLAGLKGNRFKSKRWGLNFFLKHYEAQYVPFLSRYSGDCLKLYDRWEEARARDNPDKVYQGMMQDSRRSLEVLLDNFKRLDLTARVVKIDKEIRAFTFGFNLNRDTFCILYEITDLSIKGLAQYIFCAFAEELKGYKYINIMDDSGLENLKKVKLSYHPVKLVPAYIVKRYG